MSFGVLKTIELIGIPISVQVILTFHRSLKKCLVPKYVGIGVHEVGENPRSALLSIR